MKQAFAVTSLSGLVIYLRSTPDEIKTILFLAFIVTMTDFILGTIAALVCKEFRSSKMRDKWALKTIIYCAMIVICNVATIASGYWVVTLCVYSIILTTEVGSVLEKMVKIQVYGGVSLGPLSRFITAISPYFDFPTSNSSPSPGSTVVRHTAVMSNDPREPEIHLMTTETTPLGRPKELAHPPSTPPPAQPPKESL